MLSVCFSDLVYASRGRQMDRRTDRQKAQVCMPMNIQMESANEDNSALLWWEEGPSSEEMPE